MVPALFFLASSPALGGKYRGAYDDNIGLCWGERDGVRQLMYALTAVLGRDSGLSYFALRIRDKSRCVGSYAFVYQHLYTVRERKGG